MEEKIELSNEELLALKRLAQTSIVMKAVLYPILFGAATMAAVVLDMTNYFKGH